MILTATAALAFYAGVTAALAADTAIKQDAPPGWNGQGDVVRPDSSKPQPPGRERTHHEIFVPRFDQPPGEQPGGNREPQDQQPRR
jgi:hypothetical protein